MLIARIAYFVTILLFPFYLFPSGGFQMSSAALLITFVLVLVFGWKHIVVGSAVYTHAIFIAYAAVVNIAWYFISDNNEFLVYMAFLLVTGIMYFCSVMVGRAMSQKDAKLLIVLIFGTTVAQLVIVFIHMGGELTARQFAFFNNPNQLAYFVAACSGLTLLLSHLYKVRSTLVLITCVIALIISAFTASRGGVAACLIYVLLSIFGSSSLSRGMKIFAVVAMSAAVLVSFERFLRTPTFESLNERVVATDEVDDTLEQRGYDRIFDNTDNLVWGVGEGAFERFDAVIELHSYFGTLLFSYGVVGVILFLWFLKNAIPDWRCFTYLIPLAAYNLTHNGGRSLMLWALFGLMAAATLPAIGQHAAPIRTKTRKRRRSKRGLDV